MITLQQVSKVYGTQYAVRDVSFTIHAGEIFGLIGPSGAGKSTILRMMNLLERPSAGDVIVANQTLTTSSEQQLREARKNIGMIFQQFNLLANQTVFQNVDIALKLTGMCKKQRHARVLECLQFVGLEAMASKYPAQLSGGQKQRVAIARALATKPSILLCDEPTSALDTTTTSEILQVLLTIQQQLGITIVIVSHELEVIKSICQRVCVLTDGEVYEVVDIEPAGIQQQARHPQSFVDELLREVR